MTAAIAIPRAMLAVMLASALVALVIGATFPLIDPDEGRNAEVMREMARDGDVVVPHLAGLPYLDKPPGLFALGAASIRLFGATPLAARLPALLAALTTLAVLGLASARLEPAGHATRAGLLLAAAPLFTAMSAYVIFDMPLTACVTVVWTCIALELDAGPTRGRRLGAFAAVAAGVLLKGPVMLAWAIGGSAAAACLLRSRAPLAWLGDRTGWVLLFATAGTWFAAAVARHPEYVRYAFLEESFERMTSATAFRREQPIWFVPAVLAGGALPWSIATPWGKPRSRASVLAAGFVLFAALFFTVSRSKLVTYLLPAFPALAWWAAECWGQVGRERRAGLTLSALLALVAIAALALFVQPPPTIEADRGALLAVFAAAFLLLPFAIGAAVRRSRTLGIATTVAFAPLLFALVSPALLRHARASSGAALATAIRETGAAAVRYEGCYSPGTDFLLDRLGTVVSDRGHELTSNYVVRYRTTLVARGQWRLVDPGSPTSDADVLVRSAKRPRDVPVGWVRFHEDARFVAYRPAPPP